MASEGGEKIEVAVKTLKEGADKEDKIKFLQEAAIMGQFSHPNVVKLYGIVTEGEPVSL
jgi:serine/threonine protein kinase